MFTKINYIWEEISEVLQDEYNKRTRKDLAGIFITFIILLFIVFSFLLYKPIKYFIDSHLILGLLIIFTFLFVFAILLIQLVLYLKEEPICIVKIGRNYFVNIKNKTIDVEDINYYQHTSPPCFLYKVEGKKIRRKIRLMGLGKTTKEKIESVIPKKNIFWT